MAEIEPHLKGQYATNGVPKDYWWLKSKKGHSTRAENLQSMMQYLLKQHNMRLREQQSFVRQYGNTPTGSIELGTFNAHSQRQTKVIRMNLIRSFVDTAVAHVAKEKNRVFALTNDADLRLAKFGEQITKMILGLFQQNKVYHEGPRVFRDAALVGTGHFKVACNPVTNDIEIERVHDSELFWDYADAFHGCPRTLYHRRPIAREVAIAKWPTHKRKILEADLWVNSAGSRNNGDHMIDHVELIEAWHLPSYPGAEDGKRILAIGNAELEMDDWEWDFFPFATMYWCHPIFGVNGDGLAATIAGYHLALNNHLYNMEESVKKGSRLRTWIEAGSQISADTITDKIGAIYQYTAGTKPPVFDPGRSLDPQWLNYAYSLIDWARDAAGMNQLMTSGAIPKGLESGKAIREASDQEAVRFSTVGQNYEDLFLDLAKICIKFADKYWSGKKKIVKVKGRNFIEKINFDSIDLDADAYELDVMPTSMLPKTVAGRMAMIDEWEQKGWIDKAQAMQLMNMPDIDRAADLAAASLNDIDTTIERMVFDNVTEKDLPENLAADYRSALDDDEREAIIADFLYLPPEPPQNLALGMRRMTEEFLRLRHTNISAARLNNLLRWMEDAKKLMTQETDPMGMVSPAVGQGPTPMPDGAMTPQVTIPGIQPPMPPANPMGGQGVL